MSYFCEESSSKTLMILCQQISPVRSWRVSKHLLHCQLSEEFASNRKTVRLHHNRPISKFYVYRSFCDTRENMQDEYILYFINDQSSWIRHLSSRCVQHTECKKNTCKTSRRWWLTSFQNRYPSKSKDMYLTLCRGYVVMRIKFVNNFSLNVEITLSFVFMLKVWRSWRVQLVSLATLKLRWRSQVGENILSQRRERGNTTRILYKLYLETPQRSFSVVFNCSHVFIRRTHFSHDTEQYEKNLDTGRAHVNLDQAEIRKHREDRRLTTSRIPTDSWQRQTKRDEERVTYRLLQRTCKCKTKYECKEELQVWRIKEKHTSNRRQALLGTDVEPCNETYRKSSRTWRSTRNSERAVKLVEERMYDLLQQIWTMFL